MQTLKPNILKNILIQFLILLRLISQPLLKMELKYILIYPILKGIDLYITLIRLAFLLEDLYHYYYEKLYYIDYSMNAILHCFLPYIILKMF